VGSEAAQPLPRRASCAVNEQRLLKLYMELTGTAEPAARNVFMMICSPNGDPAESDESSAVDSLPKGQSAEREPQPRFTPPAAGLLLALGL
jgi:hypothetical protein